MDTPLRFVIASDAWPHCRPVQQAIMDAIYQHHYCDDAVHAVRISLEEALINAMKHGNKFDAKKKVRITATISDEQAEFVIEDEGCGFDRGRVPDPTRDENLEKLSGRGLLLIESFMHEVQWSCGGRRLRMVRRNVDDVRS